MSQTETIYSFRVYNKTFIDSNKTRYYGSDLEFNSKRIFLADSSFFDDSQFTRKKSPYTTDTFKVIKSKWFFKDHGQWQVFFDQGRKVKSAFYISGERYKIVWGKKRYFGKIKSYKLSFEPIGFESSHGYVFYFSPIYGIIAVSGHVLLLREDVMSKL
jgi:hypothetical protein